MFVVSICSIHMSHIQSFGSYMSIQEIIVYMFITSVCNIYMSIYIIVVDLCELNYETYICYYIAFITYI